MPNEVVYVYSMNDGEMILFREALAYLPQRAVTDNTKAAGIRIKKKFPEAKIILEAHDALLFSVRIEYLEDFIPIAKKEMERPINFTACSLPRRYLEDTM